MAGRIADVLRLLEADAYYPKLGTHKLKGRLADRHACSGGYDVRILFSLEERDGQQVVVLKAVGTHAEVY